MRAWCINERARAWESDQMKYILQMEMVHWFLVETKQKHFAIWCECICILFCELWILFFCSFFYHLLCRISGTSIFIIMIFRSFQPRLILSFRFYAARSFTLFFSLVLSISYISQYFAFNFIFIVRSLFFIAIFNGIVEIVAHHFLSNARMRLYFILFYFTFCCCSVIVFVVACCYC